MLKSTGIDIGVVGYGFVGKACALAFENDNQIFVVDPLYNQNTIAQLVAADPELVFVAVNAPTLEDGTVDTTVIYAVLGELEALEYKGVVVLKSTVPTSAISSLYRKFSINYGPLRTGALRIVYSPEFLREASWQDDAISPDMVLLSGDTSDCETVKSAYIMHSQVTETEYCITNPWDASFVKYTINAFLATKVVFFTQLYQHCVDSVGKAPDPDSWSTFTKMLSYDTRIGSSHMQVPGPDGQLGYGGSCFPKDVKALLHEDTRGNLSLLQEASLANTKIRLIGNIVPGTD